VFDVCVRQLTVRPEPLAKVAPSVPGSLAAIVDRAIEKDPRARFPTMTALSAALHEALLRLTSERRALVEHLLPGSSRRPEGFATISPLALTRPVYRSTGSLVAGGSQGATGATSAVAQAPPEPSRGRAKARRKWEGLSSRQALVTVLSLTMAASTWCLLDAAGWPRPRQRREAAAAKTAEERAAPPLAEAPAGTVALPIPPASRSTAIAPTATSAPTRAASVVRAPRIRRPAPERAPPTAVTREQPFGIADDEPPRR
jgi:hypothetical protein